jgi:hypothetical protein
MKRLSGGIDIGKDFHHMIILDEKEQVLYQKRIPQGNHWWDIWGQVSTFDIKSNI